MRVGDLSRAKESRVFLPVGDSPNPRGVAWVNWALIAANVLVFLLLFPLSQEPADPGDPAFAEYVRTLSREGRISPGELELAANSLSQYDLFVWRWGFHPAHPSLLGLFAAMFLHGGFMHLAGNMLFLWIYGDNVEHHLGRWRYLLIYLGTGVAAGLGDLGLRLGSDIPSVGASGAISGVLGCYFVWFPANRVRVFAVLFPFYAGMMELPARLVLGAYLVLDNLLPVALAVAGEAGGGGVSHGAHIGGFVAGAALAWMGVSGPLQRGQGDEPQGGLGLPRSLSAGRGAAHWLSLGRTLESTGDLQGALGAYERAIGERDRWAMAAAHLGAARVLVRGGYGTAAWQHLHAVLEGTPSPDEEGEARALLRQLQGRSRSMPRGFM